VFWTREEGGSRVLLDATTPVFFGVGAVQHTERPIVRRSKTGFVEHRHVCRVATRTVAPAVPA
jgi:hypothetical protein